LEQEPASQDALSLRRLKACLDFKGLALPIQAIVEEASLKIRRMSATWQLFSLLFS
jgi:hypothetical protein